MEHCTPQMREDQNRGGCGSGCMDALSRAKCGSRRNRPLYASLELLFVSLGLASFVHWFYFLLWTISKFKCLLLPSNKSSYLLHCVCIQRGSAREFYTLIGYISFVTKNRMFYLIICHSIKKLGTANKYLELTGIPSCILNNNATSKYTVPFYRWS